MSLEKNKLKQQNVANEPQPDYDEAEMDLLRDALKHNDKERFLMTTRLYKIQHTLNKATIIHRPYILDR
ncbi:MAG: hypothetical protein ABIQ07_09950 [Ginsengibacter sp.]